MLRPVTIHLVFDRYFFFLIIGLISSFFLIIYLYIFRLKQNDNNVRIYGVLYTIIVFRFVSIHIRKKTKKYILIIY